MGTHSGVDQPVRSPCKRGRKRIDARLALNGIIYRARTGCQWNQLPKEFGDDASIHRTLQRWEKLDLFGKLWAVLLRNCDFLGGVEWDWQSADACLSKARGVPKKGHKTTPVSVPITGAWEARRQKEPFSGRRRRADRHLYQQRQHQ